MYLMFRYLLRAASRCARESLQPLHPDYFFNCVCFPSQAGAGFIQHESLKARRASVRSIFKRKNLVVQSSRLLHHDRLPRFKCTPRHAASDPRRDASSDARSAAFHLCCAYGLPLLLLIVALPFSSVKYCSCILASVSTRRLFARFRFPSTARQAAFASSASERLASRAVLPPAASRIAPATSMPPRPRY